MPRLGLFAAALAVAAPFSASAQTVTRADLKPGLVFTQSDGTQKSPRVFSRVEPNVALNLSASEAAHPRFAGGLEFRWQGYVNVLQPGRYTFGAILIGGVEVSIGGSPVLQVAAGRDEKVVRPENVVELKAGIQPFEATLRRGEGFQAVRLELLWSGPGFRTEPMPYFTFGHLPSQRPASFASDLAVEHGRFLFEELSCGRCHRPAHLKSVTERSGPNLTEVGHRVYPGWLDAWLADPQKLRPHTTMPKVFADDEQGRAERYAVVTYLSSLGGPVPVSKSVSITEGRKSLRDGERLYVTIGCAACHGEKVRGQSAKSKVKDDPDADEKPTLQPEDSVYAVGTTGPQGRYILGGVGSKSPSEIVAQYLLNPQATNPHGRMPNMTLGGQEAQDVARFLCGHIDNNVTRELPEEPKMRPTSVATAAFSPSDQAIAAVRLLQKPVDQWKELGKRLLTAKGCIQCHTVEPGGKALPSVTERSRELVAQTDATRGCLSVRPDATKVPVYPLADQDRAALAAFLKVGVVGPDSPAPAYHARMALRRFLCLNCHQRDGEGGFSPELTEQMRALEKAENADDVAPPRLTAAGHKLRTSWLKEVLTRAGRARPWMSLRMPQYGDANVGFLTDALPRLEGTVPDDTLGTVEVSAAKIETGRALVGKSGHGCVSCHDISGVPTAGTRGPDLATTNRRVRYDWYTQWMHQPQRLAPGTRMPQYFPDGKALLTTILGGDANAQIEAMWAYLALGPGLPLPSGMEPPKGVIVAVKDRPEVLRTFMPDGAGTKAIAVGYPGGVSLVFDAATCRLGYAWTGNFLDASPVWNNRGGAPAKLLGPKFWTAPAGFPWALSESRNAVPDFAKRATDPAYGQPLPNDEYYSGPRVVQFAGYTTDIAGRPAFRYALTGPDGAPRLVVTEKPEPLPVTVAAGIKRTFDLDLPAGPTVWLNVGTASLAPWVIPPTGTPPRSDSKTAEVTPAVVGSRLILPNGGGSATVVELATAPVGTEWQVVATPGSGWQASLRLPEATTAVHVPVVLLTWGLPRLEDALLNGLKAK